MPTARKPSPRKNRLAFAGALTNGLKYEAQLIALPDGGSLQTNGATLEFKNCNSLTLIVAAGTDYAMDYAAKYRGEDPHARVTKQVEKAAAKKYDDAQGRARKGFSFAVRPRCARPGQILRRTDSRCPPTCAKSWPSAQRLTRQLEELLFQYGRYLLISCSRPGGLPANLQGLWNDNNNPPWHSDYHANINVEMNYWPAEAANLSECHQPFFDLVLSQLPAWRKATAASPEFKTPAGAMTTRGWAIRTSHNIYGGMGWKWDKTANAWYCLGFWEHYAFTGDKKFLKHDGLSGDEGNLRILGGPFEDTARRPAGRAQRLVARTRPGPGRRELQPGNRLGPVQQHRRRGGRARRGQGVSRQNRRDARQAGHAGHRQLGPVARMDDRIARPEISGTRHAQRPSPPHVASVRGLSRPADQRRQNARTGGGGEGFARRARH